MTSVVIPTIGEIAFQGPHQGEVAGQARLYCGMLNKSAVAVVTGRGEKPSSKGALRLVAVKDSLETLVGFKPTRYILVPQIYLGVLLTLKGRRVNGKLGWPAWVCTHPGHSHDTPRLFFVRGRNELDRT